MAILILIIALLFQGAVTYLWFVRWQDATTLPAHVFIQRSVDGSLTRHRIVSYGLLGAFVVGLLATLVIMADYLSRSFG